MTASMEEKGIRRTPAIFATEDLIAFATAADTCSLNCQGPLQSSLMLSSHQMHRAIAAQRLHCCTIPGARIATPHPAVASHPPVDKDLFPLKLVCKVGFGIKNTDNRSKRGDFCIKCADIKAKLRIYENQGSMAPSKEYNNFPVQPKKVGDL